MYSSDTNATIVSLVIFLALLGLAVVWIVLKFWGNADLQWSWQRKYYRYGGLKPKRTREWERTRKIPLVLLFVLGSANLIGATLFGAHLWTAKARWELQRVRFDEIELSHCSLGTLAFTNRASASRFVTIGPVRAGTGLTQHVNWPGRQVSMGMEAIGDGMISSQQMLDVSGESTIEIQAGETAAFVLSPSSGSCSSITAPGTKNGCSKLIFGFKSTDVRGASPDLDIVRYCDL